MKAAILGGGASGLACAIKLKNLMSDAEITVFEKLPLPGKKISATGNGRCNLSNFNMSSDFYNSDKKITDTVINNFSTIECMRFFSDLGMKLRDEDGRLYPYSMNANSVRDTLEIELKRLGITCVTDCKVQSLDSCENGYIVNKKEHFDTCVLALGGKAAKAHGTDGDGYKLLKELGIRYEPISPALVQIKTEERFVKDLHGCRFHGVLFLRDERDTDDTPIKYAEGELLFTEYGISGIPAMQLSGDVARMTARGEKPKLNICFTPDLGLSDINNYLGRQIDRYGENCGPEILYGIMSKKIAETVFRISDGDINKIALNIISLPLTAIGTNSWNDAQVTRGGVGAEELKDGSLETKKHENLFICGELLNVDGLCGGYNLHFAWGSGIKVAEEIAEKHGIEIVREIFD